MHYLALLSLIQKNPQQLQNYHLLRQNLFESEGSWAELTYYLKNEEPKFYQRYSEGSWELQEEVSELLSLKLQGVSHSYWGDSLYPLSFCGMPDAPLLFSYKGHPCWVLGRSLSVVGSRSISRLSTVWMEDHFADFLRTEQAVVISGGARGVDQTAHRLALRAGCPTAALLPSGLGEIYPSSLSALEKAILNGGGCLLSEYPFQQKMLKHFFHDRNRLIAALGALTFVVEAQRRSGSLITAHRSLELGKPVLVLPGHPGEISSLGNLDLLCEGASPIRDAEDLRMYFRSELKFPQVPWSIPSCGLN